MDQPILLVDDRAEQLDRLRERLRALGRHVYAVTSVPEAIEAAERTAYALAVVALGADRPARGDLVAFLTRATQPFTPILLVTTPDDHAGHLAAFSGLVDEVLVEPVDAATLAARALFLLRIHERFSALSRRNRELDRAVEQCREHTDYALNSLRDSAAVLEYNLRFAQDVAHADPDEARAALADAAEAARRIVERLGSVATLSPNTGVLEPAIRRFSLRDLALDIDRWARREARSRDIRLDWAIAPGVRVEADPELFRRVLENLLDNALRHTLAGGRIEVTAHARAASVSVRVSDTGILVPHVERAALFDRNARGVARARRGSGAGQGLYFCWRIVEAHRGTIRVEDYQGWSNTFVIELPQRVRGVLRGPAARADVSGERARSR